MNRLSIKTPAKINIGLNVIAKREDGYHNIETIFYPVALFDQITIIEADKFSLEVTPEYDLGGNNTILSAKKIFEEAAGLIINLKIELVKNIPIGAGMGGGSSDGAAVLKILNTYYKAGLNDQDLEKLSLQIGSDVPFFIDPKVKTASSRGEIFKDIDNKISLPLLIVNPGIHISTKWAFGKIIPTKPANSLITINELDDNSISSMRKTITNDFEDVVFDAYPEIASIKSEMYDRGAIFSLMTGTGSTVFAFFNDLERAKEAESYFKNRYFTFLDI